MEKVANAPREYDDDGTMLVRLSPLLTALLAQASGVAILLGCVQIAWHGFGYSLPLWSKLAIAGGSAAAVVAASGRSAGWIAVHALLPAAFFGTLSLDLPGWVFAAAALLLALTFRNTITERVPLYLSNRTTRAALHAFIDPTRPVSAIDLGCGTGAVPIALAGANDHPDSRFIGVENAPIPYLIARIRAAIAGDARVRIHWGSLWAEDLRRYDLVYAFLSPAPMPALFAKVRREMRTDGVFISNSFSVPGESPDEEIELDDRRRTRLFVWQMTPGIAHPEDTVENIGESG